MASELRTMYAVGVMAFIIFLSSLVSLPVLPRLSVELGAKAYQIPIVVSAALATVVVVQFFSGFLADRFSRRRLIQIGTLLGALSSLLCLVASDWKVLAALRVLGGVADAISMPALLAITSTLGKDSPGRFFGILRGSQGLSFVVGPAIGSGLSLLSLRTPFLVDGVLSLAAFFAAFFLIKEQENVSTDHRFGIFRSLSAAFSDGRVFLYLLLGFAGLFSFGIFSAFVPTKGELIGLSAWQIGLIITTGSITFSASSYLVGNLSDRGGRKPIVIVSLIVVVLSGVGFVYADGFFSLLICYVVYCVGEAVPYLLSFVYATESFEAHYMGAAMGAFDSLMDLSLLIGPLLGVGVFGWTGDLSDPFLIAVIPALLALLVSVGWLNGRAIRS